MGENMTLGSDEVITPLPPDITPIDPNISKSDLLKDRIPLWEGAVEDHSKRNKLLYLGAKAKHLRPELFSSAAKDRLLKGGVHGLGPLLKDPESSIKIARYLAGKGREAEFERGLSILYLAVGQISIPKMGTESDDVLAPIILFPVSLRSSTVLESEYNVEVYVTDPRLNRTVTRFLVRQRKLEAAQGINTEAERMFNDNSPLEVAEFFAKSLCSLVPGSTFTLDPWEIGFFTFSSEAIVEDLAAGLEPGSFLEQSAMVMAMAGHIPSKSEVRGGEGLPTEEEVDELPPSSEALILEADVSQRQQIQIVTSGQHRVIQGPPGTGKSQTIANLIAKIVHDGKTVLFVAEKRAALEAVQKRLSGEGLGHIMLDLHSSARQKSVFYEQLRESAGLVKKSPTVGPPPVSSNYGRWRGTLNARTRHFNSEAAETGWTYRELISQGAVIPVDVFQSLPHEVELATLLSAPLNTSKVRNFGKQKIEHEVLDTAARVWVELGSEVALGLAPHIGMLSERFDHACSLAQELKPLVKEWFAMAQKEGLDSPDIHDSDRFKLVTKLATLNAWAARDAGAADAAVGMTEMAGFMRFPLPIRWATRVLSPSRRKARTIVMRFSGENAGDQEAFHDVEAYGVAMRAVRRLAGHKVSTKALYKLSERAASLKAAFESLQSMFSREMSPPSLSWELLDRVPDWVDDLLAVNARNFKPTGNHSDFQALADGGVLATIRRWCALADPSSRPIESSEYQNLMKQVLLAGVYEDLRVKNEIPPELLLSGNEIENQSRQLAGPLEEQRMQLAKLAVNQKWMENYRSFISGARTKSVTLERKKQTGTIEKYETKMLTAYEHEINKERRLRPIREFLDKFDLSVKAARPCWALSPLAVSQLLPRKQLFDYVIFDEASQVTAPEGVPSIARGAIAVVAGDSKQLPPTAFWTRLAEEDQDEETFWGTEELEGSSAGADQSLNAPSIRGLDYVSSEESILEAMSATLNDSGTLGWHYRSQDERLIAFSNDHVYAPASAKLLTFPSSVPQATRSLAPIQFHQVASERGPTNGVSPEEAEKVVDLVVEHAISKPDVSLGVVTFSKIGADKIQDRLRERLKEMKLQGAERQAIALEEFLREDRPEPLFFKAIERVQGDERDRIILHIGWTRKTSGAPSGGFGPINRDGGERRLNVAVTRAKIAMDVVCGFDPSDLPEPEKAGPRFLKRYLEYVKNGCTLPQVAHRQEVLELTPLEKSILEALKRDNWAVDAQVGSIGYLVDLAIIDPEIPDRYVLGIECDGAQYHSSPAARDRDRTRQRQLERVGWSIHRIWSTDWRQQPEEELLKVRNAVKEAQSRKTALIKRALDAD
jgi:very-short-patch-repair endonuclease